MTGQDRAYARAWLAEMWPVVREYVAPVDPRIHIVEKSGDKQRKKAS